MALSAQRTLTLLCCLCLINSGCAVPRAGALRSEIERSAPSNNVSVKPIDAAIASLGRSQPLAELPPEVQYLSVMPTGQIGTGDQLSITILEGFSPAVPSAIGGRLELSRVDVSADGAISVPFAGRLLVAGQPIDRVRQMLEARLSRKLYEPQVQISLLESPQKSVSIVGAVAKGGAFPIAPGMTRLADLVGAAGVQAENPEQVRIELRRGDIAYPLSLKSLLDNPSTNVALRPGDVVSVRRAAGFVTLMGAVGVPGRIAIASESYSILDALAEARGLDSRSANPSGVYLFPASENATAGEPATVYSVDIRDPRQVLLARQMRLVDGDLVYVSTASFAQTIKVLDIISRTLTPLTRLPDL
jgi:polysaccharide biosynthesis/export protein